MSKFIFNFLPWVIKFVLYTGFGGAIDHYLGITKFLINIIEKILGNFYSMTDLWASWIIIIGCGLIITFISDKIGFNRWVYNYYCILSKKVTAKQEFIPLKKVIDSFKEYNIRIYPGSTQKLWSEILGSDKAIVNQELVNLLDYVIGEEIIIYGQKTESIQNLQPLNLMNINTNPFYLKENWTNDYNSVYDNGILVYTNLKVRKCDLEKLIEKYKQPRIDIINS
ncbi:MAG: hypothetical protein EBY20_02950 [Alphaproteobacteria bacterium]|nr:hypothetical protein [Alphaproteobacteria bacterium]